MRPLGDIYTAGSGGVLAFGCTGGKHRSVTMTNKLADYLKSKGYSVNVTYRDIGKE